MKVFFNRLLLLLTCLAMLAIISACGSAPKPMNVVIFYVGDSISATASLGTPENTLQPNLSQTPTSQGVPRGTPQPYISVGVEQRSGYQYAENEGTPTLQPQQQYAVLMMTYQFENDPQKEVAAMVREEVVDKEKNVIAVLGATSNENSLRLASFSNAFNVPMIIPSSIGDNLLPSNNLWVFRLSAPGSAHAQYFFGDVLTRSIVGSFHVEGTPSGSPTPTPTATPSPTPSPTSTPTASTSLTPESPTESPTSPPVPTQVPFKIAILYEKNSFGEGSAVAAAREAMKQGVMIGFYGSFDPSNLDLVTLKRQAKEEIKSVQLVYLIGHQPAAAQIVVSSIRDELKDQMPILLGQSGAFSSREFLESPEANGMFVLRQKIVSNCFAGNPSLTEVQSYAAVTLLRFASESARDTAGNLYGSQTILQKREAVRDEIKTFNRDLKCLGRVSFDNAGQNKNLEFEIMQITAMDSAPINNDAFQELLKSIYIKMNNISPFDVSP